jgi:hypothetical protein
MDDDAILFIFGDELGKIMIEVIDYIRANCVRALAPLAPIRKGLKGSSTAFQTAFGIVV